MNKAAWKSREPVYSREPVKPAYPNILMGMIFFLVSEAFLFGALFWTYYYLRGHAPVWPPAGLETGVILPAVNTLILLASSGTMWWAERTIRTGIRAKPASGLAVTIFLGSVFLGITIWEWTHEPFTPASHAYGSIFYTLTGFHALHVLGGIILLLSLLARTLRGYFSSGNYLPVTAVSLYWHFVDSIWIVVFVSLFVIR